MLKESDRRHSGDDAFATFGEEEDKGGEGGAEEEGGYDFSVVDEVEEDGDEGDSNQDIVGGGKKPSTPHNLIRRALTRSGSKRKQPSRDSISSLDDGEDGLYNYVDRDGTDAYINKIRLSHVIDHYERKIRGRGRGKQNHKVWRMI